MKGFFSLPKSSKTTHAKRGTRPKPPRRFDCDACGLFRDSRVRSPKMDPFGRGKLGILNVGEGPGEVEDEKGRQWQGPVGRLLQRTYKKYGVDLFEDCWNVNAVNCRPMSPKGGNRAPESHEISCCRVEKVNPAIETLSPSVLVVLGGPALESVLDPRWTKDAVGPISRWVGWTIPDRELRAWICPVFHPSFIARSDDEVRVIWEQDIERALGMARQPFPQFRDETRRVEILRDEGAVADLLITLATVESEVAFDIETTGLKPHADHHAIISWSFSNGKKSWAFLHPKSDRALHALKRLLRSPNIGKIAFNMKFEFAWIREKLGFEVRPFVWDPIHGTHLDDSRPGICSLKFQSFIRYGIAGYGDEVDAYLKGRDSKDANSENRIRELISTEDGIRKLLLYGGLDSLFTYWLARDQRADINSGPDWTINPEAYELVHEGTLAFSEAEGVGLRVDEELAEREKRKLTRKIDRLEARAKSGKLFKLMERRYGSVAKLNSNVQLATVLYKDMKLTPPSLTETGQGSTGEEALSQLDVPEVRDILAARKLKKVRDTYLDGFVRESWNGRVYPFFNLHTTRTFRSSSERPNFQNIPIRDEESMKVCRGILFPSEGNRILELDYSGAEVRIAACYHKDPTMIKYILDPTSDMHLDMATELFLFKEMTKTDKVHKHLRSGAKNGFVFPQFYGDYYKNCAENLAIRWAGLPKGRVRLIRGSKGQKIPSFPDPWKSGQGVQLSDGRYISDHLIDHGIKSLDDFTSHVQRVERGFWQKRFRVYAKWKDRWWAAYQERGEFEMLTGFRVRGVMKRNEAINYPVQGSAFHCLLWLFIQLTKLRREEKWKSRLIGQIHDSIVFDAVDAEIPEIVQATHELVESLPKKWSWLIVPLEVDLEATDVDRPWSEKKSVTP